MIAGILGLITQGISFFAERQKAKHEGQMAVIKSESYWEQKMAEGSVASWKDEYWTVVLSIPMILVFFPCMVPYIKAGFEVLNNDVPDWYKLAIGSAIAAAFAIKKVSDAIVTHFPPKTNG